MRRDQAGQFIAAAGGGDRRRQVQRVGQAFLDRRLNFTGIAAVIDKVLQNLDSSPAKALDDVLDADAAARRLAVALIEPSPGAFA